MKSKKYQYRSIQENGYAELRVKGSKFLAYVMSIKDEAGMKRCLKKIRENHPKATHHCSAYRYGLLKQKVEYSDDDGEPSGTAGLPILNCLKRNDLSNVLGVVVRYYGGTKLGTSGLKKAYKESTTYAIEAAKLKEQQIVECFRFTFDYALMSDVMNLLKREKITIRHQDFQLTPALDIDVPVVDLRKKLKPLMAVLQEKYLSEIDTEDIEAWKAKHSLGYH